MSWTAKLNHAAFWHDGTCINCGALVPEGEEAECCDSPHVVDALLLKQYVEQLMDEAEDSN